MAGVITDHLFHSDTENPKVSSLLNSGGNYVWLKIGQPKSAIDSV